jgi:hypothetical protein
MTYSSQGFSTTAIGGRVDHIYTSEEYCPYYREAKSNLDKWLKDRDFVEVKDFTIPVWGMHNTEETRAWYTVYKGNYKNSSEFYVYIIHNDGYGKNKDRCEFAVNINWSTNGFVWNLNRDEKNISEFRNLTTEWWEDYNDDQAKLKNR